MNRIYDALPAIGQNLAWTLIGYRRSRTQVTKRFYRTLEAWEKTVDDPLEIHHERQWHMLRELLQHARKNVLYYQFLPDPVETGDAYESITKTLAEIPPLEKSVYRARSRDFLARDVPKRRTLQLSTSGTTGTALPIRLTPERSEEYSAALWRHYRSFGVEIKDPWIQFGGRVIVPLSQREPPFWRTDSYNRRTLFSIFHMSPENLEAYIDQIHDSDVSYVQGYPSALHLMGRAMLDAGRPLPQDRIKGVFTSSESLLAFQRETIEQAFGTGVRDHYASTESAVSMGACKLNRLHVDMEFGIVEVDPVEETEEYVRGPLLVTGLGSCAVPFIRYRIGDVGVRSKRPCECGRPGDVFLDIDGRIEDYVQTPDGRLIGRLDHVFKRQFEIAEAQIIQDDSGDLSVSIVPSTDFNEEDERRLLRDLRARLGAEMSVQIRLVDSIPREANGKFRAVVSSIARMLP